MKGAARRRLVAAVEEYFTHLHRDRATGAVTAELSSHGPLRNLLNAVGGTLRPKVFCSGELADRGFGRPDLGLFSARQVRRGRPRRGQKPERGVVEVKPPRGDFSAGEAAEQVARYRAGYGLVLATNLRDFNLIGSGPGGRERRLESFSLAPDEETFVRRFRKPRAFARDFGPRLAEFLVRALTHRAAITHPKDLANLLASYARDALSRLETVREGASQLAGLREALEEALGVRFQGARGDRFFRSTLVQTLFYGVFSAWVLWNRQPRPPAERFRWREAVWHLRAPVLRALFQQIADPGRLRPLGLVEVLDWTAAALDRVDRTAFFARFREGEAVPYFYEPFLEAFDPDLRKQLGVWYTPPEVIRYMVARVDRALKDDLGIPDGLAGEQVYVLDPCCGTGAYLAEVLRRIAANLEGRGLGALVGARVREAAARRVFGFEIMPAPFVVAHLQVGLTMQDLDAALADDGEERAQVFLTNALTGWEAKERKPLLFPELEEERERAGRVKQDTPILVILGNPPYNGFAGVAVEEERELSDAYRSTRRVRRRSGRGLNDLYVRFFRMAERRIVEKTGRGIVCFISNYSWLDGLSYRGMRERYLEAFDAIRVDCLNGDIRRGGKTPSGDPDPSVFTMRGESVGIRVGTAVATLVRERDHEPTDQIGFRHLWGRNKRTQLLESADAASANIYSAIRPQLSLGLPFAPLAVADDWFRWPALPDLFAAKFHGVLTNRDALLVDVDLARLRERIEDYFDPELPDGEIARRSPVALRETRRFAARRTRAQLLDRGGPDDSSFLRFCYRPFDIRWLYWERETKLVEERRAEYRPHVTKRNVWLTAAKQLRKGATEPQAVFSSLPVSHHLIERGTNLFPAWLSAGAELRLEESATRPNLTTGASQYLDSLGASVDDLFHHVLALLHDPEYRRANAGALSVEWPRIPMPGWPEGTAEGAAEALAESAARGRRLASLLDPDTPVPGVTTGALRPELVGIAVPTTASGRNMTADDFAVTAGWGHFGSGSAVMPGAGRTSERDFRAQERTALAATGAVLGKTTFDIHLNDRARFRNVPAAVWNYRLGGYQVLKKWLSYRERKVLGRPLRPNEVQHFTETARRIAAILLLIHRNDP